MLYKMVKLTRPTFINLHISFGTQFSSDRTWIRFLIPDEMPNVSARVLSNLPQQSFLSNLLFFQIYLIINLLNHKIQLTEEFKPIHVILFYVDDGFVASLFGAFWFLSTFH